MNATAVIPAVAALVASAASSVSAFDCAAGVPYHSIGPGVLGGFDYAAIGGDFIVVDSETANAGGEWLVLEHCPTRMHLTVVGDPRISDAARDDFWRMVNSDQGYTLLQMSDVLLETGLGIGVGQGQVDSCPCALQADPATRKVAD